MPRVPLYLAPLLALACGRPDDPPPPAPDGPIPPVSSPAQPKATPERDPDDVLTNIVDIQVMLRDSMCALDTQGRVYCWGRWTRAAEREEDRSEFFVRPQQIDGLPRIQQLGSFGSPIAVAEGGALFEWALDRVAPILRARPMGRSIPPTAALRPDGRVDIVALNAVEEESTRNDLLGVVEAVRQDHEDMFLCSVEVSGQVHCAALWPPRPEAPGHRFRLPAPATSIGGTGSNGNFIVVLRDGRTVIWGPELEVSVRDAPRLVQASRENVHSCGVDRAGEVYCWEEGGGANYQHATTPKKVAGAGPAAAVAALPVSACALQTNGTVRCWGRNEKGQCGTGSQEQQVTEPTPVLGPREDQ